MNGTDPLIRSQVVFCCDYWLVLNQNLVQDVQGLSLLYALKIAGPKNLFIGLVRPRVELNHVVVSLFGEYYAIGDIWPQNHHILIRYFT